MDFDDLELGEDELATEKTYTPEQQEEINELWSEIAYLAAEITT